LLVEGFWRRNSRVTSSLGKEVQREKFLGLVQKELQRLRVSCRVEWEMVHEFHNSQKEIEEVKMRKEKKLVYLLNDSCKCHILNTNRDNH